MQQKIFNIKVLQNELKKTSSQIPEVHSEIVQSWAESIKNKAIYKQKETALHGHFIQRVLLDILGYDGFTDGKSAWNLQREQQIGSGSVDVALGTFTNEGAKEIIAPFELKGAKTKDLDAIMAGRHKSPVQQAWEYATDNKGTKWVLVSNYTQIRLYNYSLGKHAYESFDLSKLDVPEEYQRLKLLIGAQNLLTGKTLELLEKSEQADKEITNALYKDYKTLREKLITTLGKENPNIDQIELINISQLILDRILFIAFAEDKQLLPDRIIAKAYATQNTFNPQPIWQNFLYLFTAIDKGNKELNIPQYNGGLFKHDPRLENIIFPDELCNNFKELAEYDFDSEVSVNILGHIFEQSISDIEEIKARAAGESFDKKQSKRKKDGVFYTPQYITRYIVEQAVGRWLEDKKQELGFYKLPDLEDSDYEKIKPKNKPTGKIAKHFKYWQAYKDQLANITIVDPACGSGAFLNEVFDYLLLEGEEVNREIARLRGGQGELFRWDTHILANNIFGVDINAESVEITKLGLWLKTANKREPLTYLEDNIKVGNSLIDDPEIAGDLAFNWQEEFKEIMANGGFDVVVGNPPYGAKLSQQQITHLENKFSSFEYQVNTYVLFYELGINLLQQNGTLGFITPATFTYQHYFKKIRTILNKLEIKSIRKYNYPVFEDADIGDTVSWILQKKNRTAKKTQILRCKNKEEATLESESISYSNLVSNAGKYNLGSQTLTTQHFQDNPHFIKLGDVAKIIIGIKPYQTGKGIPKQTKDTVKNKPFTASSQIDSEYKLCIVGSDFHRYTFIQKPTMYLKYGDWLAEPRKSAPFFDAQKIIIRQTSDTIIANLDTTKAINLNNVYNIGKSSPDYAIEYLLALLNSKFMQYIYQDIAQEKGKLFAEVKKVYLNALPIKKLKIKKQNIFIEKSNLMLLENHKLSEISQRFLQLLKSRLNLEKTPQKLEKWYELSFDEFKKELKKKKITLSLSEEAEWLKHFTQQQAQARAINEVIAKTDAEIDQMVYKLYELTPEEIKIVEN